MAERDYNPQQAQGSSPVSPLLLLTLSLGTLVYLQSPSYSFPVVGVATPSHLLHEHTTTAGSGLRNIMEGLQRSKQNLPVLLLLRRASDFPVVGVATLSHLPHEHTTTAGSGLGILRKAHNGRTESTCIFQLLVWPPLLTFCTNTQQRRGVGSEYYGRLTTVEQNLPIFSSCWCSHPFLTSARTHNNGGEWASEYYGRLTTVEQNLPVLLLLRRASDFPVVGVATLSHLLHEHTTTAGSGLRNIKEGLQRSKQNLPILLLLRQASYFPDVGVATLSHLPH